MGPPSFKSQQWPPSKAIFKHFYRGKCRIRTSIESTYYEKVISKINKAATITSTAHNQKSGMISNVQGVIAKVTVQFGNGYSGKTIGSFLNVTRWSASMVPAKGYPDKGIN